MDTARLCNQGIQAYTWVPLCRPTCAIIVEMRWTALHYMGLAAAGGRGIAIDMRQ